MNEISDDVFNGIEINRDFNLKEACKAGIYTGKSIVLEKRHYLSSDSPFHFSNQPDAIKQFKITLDKKHQSEVTEKGWSFNISSTVLNAERLYESPVIFDLEFNLDVAFFVHFIPFARISLHFKKGLNVFNYKLKYDTVFFKWEMCQVRDPIKIKLKSAKWVKLDRSLKCNEISSSEFIYTSSNGTRYKYEGGIVFIID